MTNEVQIEGPEDGFDINHLEDCVRAECRDETYAHKARTEVLAGRGVVHSFENRLGKIVFASWERMVAGVPGDALLVERNRVVGSPEAAGRRALDLLVDWRREERVCSN